MTVSATDDYSHGQFCWVDLVAHEMGPAARFYAELFGWTIEEQDTDGGPPYSMFVRDGAPVAGIGQMSDEMKVEGAPPSWNSYICVDDVREVTERAGALGAEIVAPPTQMMDAGWLSFVQDPTGATVAFWEAVEHSGAARVNEPGTFCWNELTTPDLETAKEFFGELLGWTYDTNTESKAPYYIIENEGRQNGGILQMTDEWEGVPPHWVVYFAVADVNDSAESVADLGGELRHGPFNTPVGRMLVAADPQGAIFHLVGLRGPDR